jgi:hypothetical protein
MNNEKVEIKVLNISDTNKKNYLGSVQFDIQRLYNQTSDHSLKGQWIGLFNYENELSTGVNGFLKISIAIQHESDKKIVLTTSSKESSKGNILLPPQLRQNMSFRQLALYIYEAINIPDMDTTGIFKSDEELILQKKDRQCQGYVTIEYGGITLQTKVVNMSGNRIIWDQIIKIPIPEPRVSDKLFIRIYDKDTLSSELIATYELNLNDVISSETNNSGNKNSFIKPKRIHFYGSVPSESSSENLSKIMNDNSEVGILYKGSLKLKIIEEKPGQKPLKEVEDFKRDTKELVDRSNDSWNFRFRLYNYYCFNNPNFKEGNKVKFIITMGEKECHFEDVDQLNKIF